MIRSQLNISLLITDRSDQSINLGDFNFIQFLDGLLDLIFVAFGVDDEDEGVVVFDFFHGGFGGQRVFDDDKRKGGL